jgi:glucosamine--fructose-6-phosphate aminotransferase (isomerizing)
MCGIVGYIGHQNCVEILFEGLQRLEYRGYDSAGISVLDGGEIGHVKQEGKLVELQPLLGQLPQNAKRGIGHTRWATHGAPTTLNAHPHVSENVALVHNGIIENYQELKKELSDSGIVFKSETDTEVVLHLLVRELKTAKSINDAIHRVIDRLEGAFSLGVIVANEPNAVYAVKQGSPLVIGVGKKENYFASDAMAIIKHTNKAIFLNDGEIARISEENVELWNFAGKELDYKYTILDMSSSSAEKGGFRHFMLKEIHEQPRVMSNMIKRLVNKKDKTFNFKELGLEGLDLDRVTNVAMVACGTAYYSCVLGKYFLEPLAGIPVNVELASEFRYRKPWMNKSTLFISLSQSGETADTLACVKHAKEQGCQIMSICNVKMSSIPRASDVTLHMDAGPEIGVASTKAFTSMLLAHYLFAYGVAEKKGLLDPKAKEDMFRGLQRLPLLMDQAVDLGVAIEELSNRYYEAANFIFMGRGNSFAIALEGALKLKEISYIHAEGYAGGELKHGPIALIDQHMPTVAIAPQDFYYEKMLSNIEEVKARKGRVISVGRLGDKKLKRLSDDYIACPHHDDQGLQAILSVVPLQLFSYYVAVKRGTDVDQPRNLAKSVTVE